MKKFKALLLAISLLSLTLTGFPASAEDAKYQFEVLNYEFLGTSPTGLNDYVLLDESGNVIDNKGLVALNTRDRLLPSSFDLRDVSGISYVTSVKNQGGYGTCWSFASTGALESNLIMQGLADTTVDLSELHTAWYAYTKDSVSGSTTYNDGNTYSSGSDRYNAGGWAKSAYGLWGSAEGVQEEVNAPYSNASNSSFFTEMQRKESYYRVKNAYEIPVNNSNAVKSSLMENGAMYISIYWKDACYNAATASYYNPSYNAYNDPDPYSGGHAILVVGWDNAYSKTNFATAPTNDGAWLCRNSWGTGWGNGGYFWISYQDFGINSFTAFIGTTSENYDNYNQYERNGFILPLVAEGAARMANVFTAPNASTLEAVAFRAECQDGTDGTPGINYTIKVYTGLPETVTNPTSGTLSATVTGHTNFGGYFTVDLTTPISLNANEKYAVDLEISSSTTAASGGRIVFGSETLVGYSGLTGGVNTVAGRSFCYNGSTWIDTFGTATIWGLNLDGNFPIKALTDDQDTTYASTRALVQQQLDETEGCTQGTATVSQWTAFTNARTLCTNVIDDPSVSKADLNNAVIRMKIARENAIGELYPTSPDYTLSISGGIATVIAYTGTSSTVTVPKTLNGCTLSISSTAFSGNTTVKTVYFEGNINSIASDAFSGCTNLQFVYFMGNAPSVTGTIGAGSPVGIPTFYKSGTTGWTNSPWGGNATAVVPGDFNGLDGMNMADAVAFIQRLAQVGSYTLNEFAAIDITRDGAVNMADIVKLVQALANPAIILQ